MGKFLNPGLVEMHQLYNKHNLESVGWHVNHCSCGLYMWKSGLDEEAMMDYATAFVPRNFEHKRAVLAHLRFIRRHGIKLRLVNRTAGVDFDRYIEHAIKEVEAIKHAHAG